MQFENRYELSVINAHYFYQKSHSFLELYMYININICHNIKSNIIVSSWNEIDERFSDETRDERVIGSPNQPASTIVLSYLFP